MRPEPREQLQLIVVGTSSVKRGQYDLPPSQCARQQ